MNSNLKSSRRIASVLLLGAMLASCASGPDAPSHELMQRIESARTRGDHEALATYYQHEADAARAIAAKHRTMAASYQRMFATGLGAASMSDHCNAIVRSQETIAAEYEGLAEGHQYVANQIRP